VAAKGEWPKSFVIPSILLTLGAAVLLIWHVEDPTRKIDAWTVALLVVAFLPWLRTVFDSITFPGGGAITYRELKAVQEQQQYDLDALRFVVANFLAVDEKQLLRKFADDHPYEVPETVPAEVADAIENLSGAGLIERNVSRVDGPPRLVLRVGPWDIKKRWHITELGKEYLQHLDATDKSQ
jgi:hypothetical protein